MDLLMIVAGVLLNVFGLVAGVMAHREILARRAPSPEPSPLPSHLDDAPGSREATLKSIQTPGPGPESTHPAWISGIEIRLSRLEGQSDEVLRQVREISQLSRSSPTSSGPRSRVGFDAEAWVSRWSRGGVPFFGWPHVSILSAGEGSDEHREARVSHDKMFWIGDPPGTRLDEAIRESMEPRSDRETSAGSKG